jgi:hypothetical protein
VETDAEFGDQYKRLAERLNRCDSVTRFDADGRKEAWTLALTLLDLAESFRTYLDEQLPRLTDEELDCEEIQGVLLDIGEELRHVLYHIRDPRFFAYLRDDTPKEA